MESQARRGSYVVGFVLAVVLTAIPFGVVAKHYTSPSNTLVVIAVAAVLQILVHLRFFLHLRLSGTARENLLAIAFAAVLILIMMGGSLWIMFDLSRRMAV
jgi:cytochrome o ubiquinol oxidase operon protein cyoD